MGSITPNFLQLDPFKKNIYTYFSEWCKSDFGPFSWRHDLWCRRNTSRRNRSRRQGRRSGMICLAMWRWHGHSRTPRRRKSWRRGWMRRQPNCLTKSWCGTKFGVPSLTSWMLTSSSGNWRYFLVFTTININCASMVALDGYMTSISLSIHQRQQLLCPVKVASFKKKKVKSCYY